MRAASTPKPRSAASASPDSLSRMRLKTGVGIGKFQVSGFQVSSQNFLLPSGTRDTRNLKPETFLLSHRRRGLATLIILLRSGGSHGHPRLADLEAGEAAHGDVLAQLADLAGDELRDRDGLVLNERLLEQAD